MTKNKMISFALGTATIALSLFVVFFQYNEKQSQMSSRTQTKITESANTNTTTNTSVKATTITTTPKPTTTTPKAPTTPVTPKANEYTLAQVATHNSASNCWTTINGSVYNVTPFIDQHPGGANAILSLCGIDGSFAFDDQHGGQRRPASELASFKIGTLK